MTTTPTTPPSGGSPSPASVPFSTGELAALAVVLAGEHAAVYAYGVVGGQGGPAYRRVAREQLAAHGVQRDLLAGELMAAGTTPAPGEPAYLLPFAVQSVADARRLAAHVETTLAAAYADLVAASAPVRRPQAARWLGTCAVQARRWGAAPQPFPGLPERVSPG